MATELRDALTALIALAAIVGLFLAASANNVAWLFYAVCVVAALIGFRRRYGWVPTAIRAYNPLLRQVGELKDDVRRLTSDNQAAGDRQERAERAVKDAYSAGWYSGRYEMSEELNAPPRAPLLEAALVEATGRVLLYARFESPGEAKLGQRFALVLKPDGSARGVVRVAYLDSEDPGLAHLEVIRELVPDYWTELRARAVYDTTCPPNATLTTDVPPATPEEQWAMIEGPTDLPEES